MEQHIKNIQEFADKHKVYFEQQGECGFGRECVGLTNGREGNYIDYNPTDNVDYEPIEHLKDERLWDIVPQSAYHKHDCFAVLGRGEEAIKQLSEWIDKLKELDVTLESYKTGATGLQALISGTTGYAFKVNKP